LKTKELFLPVKKVASKENKDFQVKVPNLKLPLNSARVLSKPVKKSTMTTATSHFSRR